MKYEKCCRNCEHAYSISCKSCATFDENAFENFELRSELAKIENGTMVELPCKVGDFVYWRNDTICGGEIAEIQITLCENPWGRVSIKYDRFKVAFGLRDFNKTWFLSKEDLLKTEERTKELKRKTNDK